MSGGQRAGGRRNGHNAVSKLRKVASESNPGNPRGFECSLIQLSSEEIQLYSIDVLVQRNLFGRRVQALSSFRSLL